MDDDPMEKYFDGMPPELAEVFRKWADTIAENERLREQLIVWKGIAAGHQACYERLKDGVTEVLQRRQSSEADG